MSWQAEGVEEIASGAEETTCSNARRGEQEGATPGTWRSCKFSSAGARELGEEGAGGAESQVGPVVCVVGVTRNIEEFGLYAEDNEKFLKDVKQRSDVVPALSFAPSSLTPRPAHPALCFYPPA